MRYVSTRGGVKDLGFKDAVMMGLAEDGGLIIPETVPVLSNEKLNELSKLSYPELAYEIISLFVTDMNKDDLRQLINKSYASFTADEVIPLVKKGGIHIGELFHGPTFAFKDVALQFLGNLFEYILKERGEKLNIIGATSGDTGSAAIAGVRGKENINIFIMHPKGRVSAVQEMQMTSVTDDNVFNLAVEGTFDDCQYIVKEIFADIDFKKKHQLGAVNSINWARVLAQIVYYFYMHFRASEDKSGSKSVFIVPTGNFGNIFAGYYAKLMGLPVERLILATNANNILTRFVKDGDYSVKDVVITHSPSMDIQLASNLERYLYFLYGTNPEKIKSLMAELSANKSLNFKGDDLNQIHADFGTYSADNDETLKVISSFYKKYEYILDPHTACGVAAALAEDIDKDTNIICLSTAHPAKFPEAVNKAVGIDPEKPEGVKALEGLPRKCSEIENDTEKVKAFIEANLDENAR